MANAKFAAVGIIGAAGIAVLILWQHRLSSQLQHEKHALQVELAALHQSYGEARKQIETLAASADRLAKQQQELAQLRNALQQTRGQLEPLKQGNPPSTEPQHVAIENESPAPEPPVTEAEIGTFLQQSKAQQGEMLGHLRRQMMGREKPSDPGQGPARSLASAIRPKLEELESHPEQFAEFQTSFVKSAIELQDEAKLRQIQQIVEQTYQKAVAEKLDAGSRPTDGVDAWALRRDALDRRATRAVQDLLSPDERAQFDRAFLGIMGIDLGLHDGAWHRFVLPGGGVVFPSEQQAAVPAVAEP